MSRSLGLVSALATAARLQTDSYLHMLPTLGPLQMVSAFVKGARVGAIGVAQPTLLQQPPVYIGRSIYGVAALSNDSLLVSDCCSPDVVRLLDAGSNYRDTQQFGSLQSPHGVAAADNHAETFYVCDSEANRLCLFSLESASIIQHHLIGTGANTDATTALRPCQVGVDLEQDYVAVTVIAQHCIVVYRRDGTFVRHITHDSLRSPCGVAYDPRTGDIVMCDNDAHFIATIRSDGTLLSTIAAGQIRDAIGLAVDSNSRIVCGDQSHHRVVAYEPSGEQLWTYDVTHGGQQSYAGGVAIDSAGRVAALDLPCGYLHLLHWK